MKMSLAEHGLDANGASVFEMPGGCKGGPSGGGISRPTMPITPVLPNVFSGTNECL